MNIFLSGRQTGRSTALIKLCAEAEAKGEVSYIICRNHDHAYLISRMAKELDLNISFPITYEEFLTARYHGRHIKKFFIDDADALLQSLTTVPIAAVTMELTTT